MIISLFRAFLWLLGATFVVQMGWDEPLRYKFMSDQQIAVAEEALKPPPPAERPKMAVWRPQGTALDRAPYRPLTGGGIIYSTNIDANGLGAATETQRRPNVYGGGNQPLYQLPPRR